MRAVVALSGLVVLAAGCGGSSKISHKVVSATGDVKITSCKVSPDGIPVAQIKITNSSSHRADFLTTVDFTAAGTSTAGFPTSRGGVAAGGSATATATGLKAVATGSSVTCKVASVQRNDTTVPAGTPTTP